MLDLIQKLSNDIFYRFPFYWCSTIKYMLAQTESADILTCAGLRKNGGEAGAELSNNDLVHLFIVPCTIQGI